MSARTAVATALALSLACGGGSPSRDRTPPPAPADAAVEAATAVEVAPLGTASLDAWGWRRGPGAAAFARALVAERQGDLAALEREAAAALAADPAHLEAAWLVAVARARLGRTREVLAPLAIAAAGDWRKWGERSLVLGALDGFRATADGRGWVAAAERYRAAYAASLGRAVVVIGARAGERGGVGRELYAVDLDGGRWLRLTRTGGAVAGALAARGAAVVAYAIVRKGKRAGLVSVKVGVVDRSTGRTGRELTLDDAAAVTLAWRDVDGEPTLHAALTPTRGRGRTSIIDWRRGTARDLAKPPTLRGERLSIGAGGVGLRRLPIAKVSADWDDGTASAVRFELSGKVVAAPGGGLVDGESLTLDPGGARAAFLTASEPACDPAAARALYLVEVPSGQLRRVGGGALTAPTWLDGERVAVTAGDHVELFAAATGAAIATIAGGAGVTTLAIPPRRTCADPPPLFADPEPPEPDEWIETDDDGGDAGVDAGSSPDAGTDAASERDAR